MPDDSLDPTLAATFGGGVDPTKLADATRVAQGALSTATARRDKARETYGTSVQDTLRAIDEATKTLREAHTSKDRWNLPALAFASGMLRTQPGVASNFLGELGNGLAAMGPVVQQQRMSEEQFWKGIADLSAQRGNIASEPAKLDLSQAEKDALEARKMIQQLSIAGSRLEKPTALPDGSVIFRDPKNPGRFIIRQPDGETQSFDPSTGTTSPIPQGDNVPGAPAIPGTPTPGLPGTPAGGPMPPSAAAADPVAYLKTIRPDFDPSKFNEGINWAKFAEIASQRPKEANRLLKALLYEDDPLIGLSQHGNRKATELKKIESLLTQVDPSWSYTDLGQAVKNANDPKWVGQGSTKAQLNTVMGHMEELLHAYEKQGNVDITAVNRIKNKMLDMFGLPTNVDQKVAAKFVADETAKYLSGQGGSALADREELARLFSGEASPEQALSTLKTVMALTSKKASELAGIRQEAMKNRRKITMEDVLSPEAKKSVDMIGKTVVIPDKRTGKPRMLVPGLTKIEGLGTYQGGDPRDDNSWK